MMELLTLRYGIASVEGDTAHAVVVCPSCDQEKTFSMPAEGLRSWLRKDDLIQNALPTLTDAEREMLISGTCDPCFKDLGGEG